jgi:hypothetical protein
LCLPRQPRWPLLADALRPGLQAESAINESAISETSSPRPGLQTDSGWTTCAGRPTKGDHVKLKISKEGLSPGDICEVTQDDRDQSPYKLTKLGTSSVKSYFKVDDVDKVQRSGSGGDDVAKPAAAAKPAVAQKAATATHHLFRHPTRGQWYLQNAPFDPAIVSGNVAMISGDGPVPTGVRTWRVRTGGQWVSAEVTVRALDQAAAQAAIQEQRRRALSLPLTATDGECEVAELAAAAARGERTFTVDGAAVGFEVAEFGPTAAALAPTAAVLAVPLLASMPLTNVVELRGRVAVVQRGDDGLPFVAHAWRAQQAGAVAVVIIHNERDTPQAFTAKFGEDQQEMRQRAVVIAIPALCVGKADGERLLLGGAAAVAFGYDKPAEKACSLAASVAQAKLVVHPPACVLYAILNLDLTTLVDSTRSVHRLAVASRSVGCRRALPRKTPSTR